MERDNSALIKEVTTFVEREGFRILGSQISDWGETVKLVIEKGGSKSFLPLTECFYDTDSEGRMTKFRGVLDIRDTSWYKDQKRLAV